MASIRPKSGWWVLLAVVLLVFFGYLTPPNRFRTRTVEEKDGRVVVLEDPKGIRIRTESDFDRDGTIDAVNLYVQGKDVLQIGLKKDGTPNGYWVSFYDEAGKLTKAYVSRGHDEFTDRISYTEGKPQMEIWLAGSWQAVELHDSTKGVFVDGVWQPVGFTNGAWYVKK